MTLHGHPAADRPLDKDRQAILVFADPYLELIGLAGEVVGRYLIIVHLHVFNTDQRDGKNFLEAHDHAPSYFQVVDPAQVERQQHGILVGAVGFIPVLLGKLIVGEFPDNKRIFLGIVFLDKALFL